MIIPSKSRTVSLVLKIIVIISASLGVSLSALAPVSPLLGGSRVFMFFTIQSNIAIALISLIGAALLLRGGRIGAGWQIIKYVGTVSITLTGAVFTFVLAPTLGDLAWNVQNVLTHVVVPAAAIVDFFVTGVYGKIKKRNVFYVLLPPLAYAVYAAIGYVAGWEFAEGQNYPYFFLNWGSPAGAFGFTNELPYMGCAWWIIALMILLLTAGLVYLLIIDGAKKIRNKKKAPRGDF